jgi:hypothetical protein
MRSVPNKVRFLFGVSLFLALPSHFVRAEAEKDEGNIGEVRYSILNPAQFRTLYGPEWILMDGSAVGGSDLAKEFGWTNVPDGRGVFLRGKDHGRGFNPDGNIEVGTYQADQFTTHNHGGGDHQHFVHLETGAGREVGDR